MGQTKRTILAVIPVYNDWTAAAMLLDDLDRVDFNGTVHVMFVDDASTDAVTRPAVKERYASINEISVLRLNRNLGHQRASAIGMAYACATLAFDAMIVMDADGEDRPQDIRTLIDTFDENKGQGVVFAARRRRTAALSFKLYYLVYLMVSKILTGFAERVGNFSVLSRATASRLVQAPELLMHYSSTVQKLKIPFHKVKIDRGKRYHGSSKMGFTGLVMHGLLAIAVHRERVAIRAFIFCAFSSFLLLAGIPIVACVRFFTDMAIPGWATSLTGMLLILLSQLVGLGLFTIFIILGSRSLMEVVPARDFGLFIEGHETWYHRAANSDIPAVN